MLFLDSVSACGEKFPRRQAVREVTLSSRGIVSVCELWLFRDGAAVCLPACDGDDIYDPGQKFAHNSHVLLFSRDIVRRGRLKLVVADVVSLVLRFARWQLIRCGCVCVSGEWRSFALYFRQWYWAWGACSMIRTKNFLPIPPLEREREGKRIELFCKLKFIAFV